MLWLELRDRSLALWSLQKPLQWRAKLRSARLAAPGQLPRPVELPIVAEPVSDGVVDITNIVD